MISEYVYYILWLLAHTIVALITQTRDVYLLGYNRLKRGTLAWRANKVHIFKCIKLKKLPQHVTILLPPGQHHNLDDLVNLVLWSLATHIPYISFYDPLGLLLKKEELFINKIQSKLHKGQHVIWHGVNTSSKNGFSGPKIHVKLLSAGRASLIDTCKQLSTSRKSLTVPIVNQHQQKSYEFPDPQLAIYFGKYLNLCGYPPWQIRLTEFVHGQLLDSFCEHKFVNVLKYYSQCQQRVGK